MSEENTPGHYQHSVENENEQIASENLASTLTRKRKGMKKKLLENTLTSEDEVEEDIGKSMSDAKQRVKQKLMNEPCDSVQEVSQRIADHDNRLDDKNIDDDAQPSSAQATARSTMTPRGATPRKGMSDSLNVTLKAKYLEKFKAAKDEGKAMQYKEKTEHRLAGKRGESLKTRFDDDIPMRDEDREMQEKLESSLRFKIRSEGPSAGSTKELILPTSEEANNFFTQVWDSDVEDSGQSKITQHRPQMLSEQSHHPNSTAAAVEEDHDRELQDEEKKETERKKNVADDEHEPLLGTEGFDEYSWRPYHLVRADYTPFQEKLSKEQETYFVPSVVEAMDSQKMPSSMKPRQLEDEGFYVGSRPYVSNHNLSRMENRLLKEARRDKILGDEEASVGEKTDNVMKWFGEDGKLITLPNPVKEISSRPPFRSEDEPLLVTPYRKPEIIDKSALLAGGRYQLDVDVNTITFSHHHLFSREHVRASQLIELYQVYISRSSKRTVEYLTGKIIALKSAIQHIEDNIVRLSENGNSTFLSDQQQRLKDYRDEVRLSRKQRDHEMDVDRTLLRNILNTWKDIKILRQTQGYTSTPVKLLIRKEMCNKEQDEEEWERDMNDEIDEMKEQADEEYNKQLDEYHLQLKFWKEQKLRKKAAQKRQTKRQKLPSTCKRSAAAAAVDDDANKDTVEQQGKDEVTLNEPDLQKPEKPKPATCDNARQKIVVKYNEIRRRPGEPKILVELTNGATITNTQDCPRLEALRRNDVAKYKIFVKVLFNGKEVSKTDTKPLGQDFIVRFARIFNLEIMYWPESIKLEICETYGLTTYLLSSVYAPIPDHNVTAENGFLTDIEFSSELRQLHSHDAVGSGVPFALSAGSQNELSLLTSGNLSASVVWAVDGNGHVLAPPAGLSQNQFYGFLHMKDPIADIGMAGLADMEKLTKWIEESHLDPNDPSNADIMHLMRPVCGGDALVTSYRLPDYFRLEHVQDEFNFATDDELDNSKRFRMIMLRDQEVPYFKNQRIPSSDKDVPEELFVEYDKKLHEEIRLRQADDSDSHHIAVAKFMQKVRERVMERYRIATHQKVYSDMIREDAVPNIGVILPKLAMLAEPQRPLRPRRIERKKVASQNLQPCDVKILVNVVRAFGIPVRERSHATKTEMAKDVSGESQVCPFIEAMFQRHVHATSVGEGPNPSWNEELCIPFRAPNNDFSPSVLQTVNDSLHLNIFDEFVVDIPQDDRERSTTIHRRVERRWLGGIKIPFTTIYTNGRVDGTFRISKPPVLLGYTYDGRLLQGDINQGQTQELTTSSGEDSTFLTLFVTMEPQLSAPEPFREKFESMETEVLLTESEKWLGDIERKFSRRNYLTTVINLEGLSIFVTRYIKPLPPPDVVKAGGDELIARYVSFIPSVSDNVVYPGLCDIWSSCAQFLHMLQGDEEEHAILLTNYFLHSGKEAWLLIGSAIPEGETAYVLTREASDYWLWNAQTGERFSYRDNYCPLQSVGCLINSENIWANIQIHDKPSQLSFDLTKASDWKPFFHKGFNNPGLPSIQPETLVYVETSETETIRLQEKIESELKKKITEWRSRYVTRWNRYCIQAFRRLLQQLEKSNGKGHQAEHAEELQQILGSYKLCGFPLNMPYTEMKVLSDAVYATGVHEYESSDVEFALAVYVHPYPNSVLSIWIYVASLIRKRS